MSSVCDDGGGCSGGQEEEDGRGRRKERGAGGDRDPMLVVVVVVTEEIAEIGTGTVTGADTDAVFDWRMARLVRGMGTTHDRSTIPVLREQLRLDI